MGFLRKSVDVELGGTDKYYHSFYIWPSFIFSKYFTRLRKKYADRIITGVTSQPAYYKHVDNWNNAYTYYSLRLWKLKSNKNRTNLPRSLTPSLRLTFEFSGLLLPTFWLANNSSSHNFSNAYPSKFNIKTTKIPIYSFDWAHTRTYAKLNFLLSQYFNI